MTKTDLHELRKDPLLGRWVAVLEPSKAPSGYSLPDDRLDDTECVLCPGNEDKTTPEIMSIPQNNPGKTSPSWRIRTIPDFNPVFRVKGELGRHGEGIYDKMNSIGSNEIVVESPDHSLQPEDAGLDQMAKVIETYRARIIEHHKEARFRYTLIYKNSGKTAGALFSHPVSNIVSMPIIPKRVKEELDGAKLYYSFKERCIFCDIAREEARVNRRIILETTHFIAFCPYASKFPFESWIVPKTHSCAFQDIDNDGIKDLALVLSSVLKRLRAVFGELPYNYFIHTAPNRMPRKNHWHTLGDDYHWHVEIIPRLLRTSGFEWGSGFYILPTSPENAAKYLKEV